MERTLLKIAYLHKIYSLSLKKATAKVDLFSDNMIALESLLVVTLEALKGEVTPAQVPFDVDALVKKYISSINDIANTLHSVSAEE